MPESKFLELKCPRCNNIQTSFGKASTWVKCKSCNRLLIKPRGGKAKIKAQIRKVM